MLRIRLRPGLLAAVLLAALAGSSSAQTARFNHTLTLLGDGNILIVGGIGTGGTPINTVELMVSTNGTLASRASLNTARSSHTATLLPDGRVLVTGGLAAGPSVTAGAETYDPRTNLWTALGSAMAFARMSHTATLLPNGKVLITGGQTNLTGTVETDCDIFDPQTNSFTTTACGAGGAMQMGRAGHTATLLHNGRVLAAGGYRTGGAGFAPTTEIYDPDADRWSAGPGIQARAWHSATQMGDRRVLIAGGMNSLNLKENRGFLETAEILDPLSGTSTPVAPMPVRRAFHTAALAGSGRVNLRGGLGNIVTTYFTADQTFEDPSSLALTLVPGSWLEATVNGAASSLRFEPAITMSVPSAAGFVVDGDIFFSSPTAALTDMTARFAYPDSAPPGVMNASIDGALIEEGAIIDQTFTMASAVSGRVRFSPQDADAQDMVLTGGSQVNTDGSVPGGTTENLTGGTLNGTLLASVPNSNIGGTVLSGRAFITAGVISVPVDESVQSFDVALTSGIADITGATVGADIDGNGVLALNVSFTSLQGTITNTTTTVITGNPSVAGLQLTGISLKLFYVISPVDMSGATLDIDIATVAVRSMVFATSADRYVPSANQWTNPADETPALFNHASALLPSGDEFLSGGRNCQTQPACSAFTFTARNTATGFVMRDEGEWSATGSLNDARANHTLTLLPDGKALAAGGGDGVSVLSSSERYDPQTQAWTRSADLKQRRSHHTATLLTNGNVLAAGGFTSNNQSTGTTNHAEVYYPGPGAWVPTGQMLSSRAYHAGVLLPSGEVLAIGGFSDGTYLSSVEVYSSTSHRWLAAPALPEARAQFTATLLRDGRILVAGGLNASDGVLNTSFLFNPQTWSWAPSTGAMIQGRYSHTATLLQDGRVLVEGGDSGLTELAFAEIFNPVSGTWTRVTSLGGNDLSIPRLNHTAALLPDGRVRFVGGFTRLGGPIKDIEGYDVAFTTFQMQGTLATARGDHATILLKDGFLLAAGGSNGVSALSSCERQYYGDSPDASTPAGAPARRPALAAVSPALFLPRTAVTATGGGFRGRTEASGGGAGSANSHHAHPRVYLQRADGASSSANDSGWSVDLTSAMLHSQVNPWSKIDSSITFTVPYTSATLPLGWYHLRVAANAQFSESRLVQVGPALPTAVPGIPSGTAAGASSIVWTWAAAAGSFDGYAVYSATNGVFISTLARGGGGTESFLQSGLGPDTSSLIMVAAYNVSGDGPVSVATITVLTAVSAINNLQGQGNTERSILWSWDPLSGATSYEVYSATSGQLIGTPAGASFTQTLLSTNTAAGVVVRGVLPGGSGTLSDPVTAYTLASQPAAGQPPVTLVSTGGFKANWLANTNPPETLYHIKLLIGSAPDVVHIASISGLSAAITPLDPNTLHSLSVAAFNGDGVYTPFTSLGSTYTLARPPTNALVTSNTPSSIGLAWDKNGNPEGTIYQVLYSTDNFVGNISTHIAFSAAFTSAATGVGSLITGTTYYFRVTARNGFGQETAAAQTSAFTDNGGGPPGSLAMVASSTRTTTLSGTLGNARRVEMTVYPGAFDGATSIFVSSREVVGLPAAEQCGAIPARISIVTGNGQQPKVPVEFGIQYFPGDLVGTAATLGIARFDAASRTCVPLESRVDTLNSIVYARTNHFTDFQLQQFAPSSSVSTARVFPNPLYTATQGYFTFDRLPAASRVRIYTIHGEEVFEQGANASGLVTWRAQNKVGRPVASGLYLAVIESGGGKHIMKLAVVR